MIQLAIERWPTRSTRQIAEQIGCSQPWVFKMREQYATRDNRLSPVATVAEWGRVGEISGDRRLRNHRDPSAKRGQQMEIFEESTWQACPVEAVAGTD
jgi:hypothetical protein